MCCCLVPSVSFNRSLNPFLSTLPPPPLLSLYIPLARLSSHATSSSMLFTFSFCLYKIESLSTVDFERRWQGRIFETRYRGSHASSLPLVIVPVGAATGRGQPGMLLTCGVFIFSRLAGVLETLWLESHSQRIYDCTPEIDNPSLDDLRRAVMFNVNLADELGARKESDERYDSFLMLEKV